ncbi:glycoprotein M [Rhinolophus gammaherpesvirus 1]|uniref:Glycoprotein M n=1 Tax=Rhinolophus gammaherpesvirus 1 TaxID=2054179 RepID=A0A2Z5U651_9GAMA|nr:glycoprotein M [Rhinolophus gammaherpesvirus 1]BBB06488.1 glycoprotein M [Rhinolophus gammaherpesvirus 1]
MKSSKSDLFIYKTWVKLLVLYFIMFAMSSVVPIVAYFPGYGFPCYFNALVNYSSLNLTTRNVAKHITPTLYLEAPEMFTYITITFIIDCVVAMYYFVGAIAIIKARKKHVVSLTTLSQWISLVGTPTIVLMGMWRLWTIQLFIQVLSYKHIYLAAFVYTMHFMISFVHVQCNISRNSKLWAIKVLEQGIPRGTLLESVVIIYKTVIVNIQLFCLGLEMLVFSLSFMMAVGNSFYVVVSDVVFGAINLHFCLLVMWFLITELYLVKYLQLQLGFHMGAAISCLILILPLWRYETVFVNANLKTPIIVNIYVMLATIILFSIIRLFRLCKSESKPIYAALPVKTSAATKMHRIREKLSKIQSSNGPSLMEEESMSETEDEV